MKKLLLRIDSEVKTKAEAMAKKAKQSLNSYIRSAVEEKLNREK